MPFFIIAAISLKHISLACLDWMDVDMHYFNSPDIVDWVVITDCNNAIVTSQWIEKVICTVIFHVFIHPVTGR